MEFKIIKNYKPKKINRYELTVNAMIGDDDGNEEILAIFEDDEKSISKLKRLIKSLDELVDKDLDEIEETDCFETWFNSENQDDYISDWPYCSYTDSLCSYNGYDLVYNEDGNIYPVVVTHD